MFKFILATLATLVLPLSSALAQDFTAKASPHNVAVDLSMNEGGFSIGAGYEYMLDEGAGWSVGGHARAFQKDRSNGANGLMIIGAQSGYHFYKKAWDLGLVPSLNIVSIDSVSIKPGDATTFGPGLALTLTTQLTERFSVGFAYSNFYVWFNSDYRGLAISDLALRGRFSF